jgi:cold shock protein
MASAEMASTGTGGGSGTDGGTNVESYDDVASMIQLSGIIKWFDVSKGYGFIVPDNGMPDILLHVTCLRRDGFQVAYEGARVVVEVVKGQRGLQAFRVLSMDESTVAHSAQMSPPGLHVRVTATSKLERAQVKWFNRLRGFGFLTCGEGAPDIFVHVETVRSSGLTELRPGQFVLVRFGPGAKGLMAAEVRPDTAPLGMVKTTIRPEPPTRAHSDFAGVTHGPRETIINSGPLSPRKAQPSDPVPPDEHTAC